MAPTEALVAPSNPQPTVAASKKVVPQTEPAPAPSAATRAPAPRMQIRERGYFVSNTSSIFSGSALRVQNYRGPFDYRDNEQATFYLNHLRAEADFGAAGIRLDIPFAYGNYSAVVDPLDNQIDLGNVSVGGFYDLSLGGSAQVRLLGNLYLPTITDPSSRTTAKSAGLRLNGRDAFANWQPHTTNIQLGARLDVRHRVLDFALQGDATAMLYHGPPIPDYFGKRQEGSHLLLQGEARLGLRIPRIATLGVEYTLLGIPTMDGAHLTHMLEPFIETDPDSPSPVYLRTSFLMHLDGMFGETLGSYDKAPWAFRIGLGARF